MAALGRAVGFLLAMIAASTAASGARGQGHGHHAHAHQPGDYPVFSLDLDLQLQSDRTYKSRTDGAKTRQTYSDSELHLGLLLNPNLSLQSEIKFDRVRAAAAGEDRFLEDQALFVEQLFAAYRRDWWQVHVGKFNPAFGLAWEYAPGLYGNDIAEDAYELEEAIGFGGSATLDRPAFGAHTVAASLFFFDNTPLSSSTLTHPKRSDRRFLAGEKDIDRIGRNRHRYGGPGNRRGPDSMSLTLDGEEMPFLPAFSYHLGFARLAEGRFTEKPSYLYAAGGQYHWKIDEDWSLRPLVEYVYRRNVDGNPLERDEQSGETLARRQHAHYLTLGSDLAYRNWTASFAYSGSHLNEPERGTGPNGRDVNEHQYSVSLAYAFDFGVALQVGWKRAELFDGDRARMVSSDTYGFLITYAVNFEY